MVAIFGFADARASVRLGCSTFHSMAAAANKTAFGGAPGYKADHHLALPFLYLRWTLCNLTQVITA
jgi:hypothetical protein